MTSSGSVVKVGKILDKLNIVPNAVPLYLPNALLGNMWRISNRILIWECPECEALWRKPQEAGEDE